MGNLRNTVFSSRWGPGATQLLEGSCPSRAHGMRDMGAMDRAVTYQSPVTTTTGKSCFGFRKKDPEIQMPHS